MNFDLDQITALAALATDKGLAEITITDGDQSVTIKTPASVAPASISYGPAPVAVAPAMAPPTAPVAPSVGMTEPAPRKANLKAITAPMVGTFYRSSAPGTPPFVDKGQTIAVGQTLCILEAMKQMNQLESELAGTVVDILIADGTPVDFGQELFLVEVN